MKRLAAATIGAALSLSGCAAFSDDSASSAGEVEVAAAFYPLEYVAQRVAGGHAEVENLTTPGREPHDLSLSVVQTALVSEADLVVYASGFQPAVDDAVENNAGGTTLDAAEAVHLVPAGEHAEHEDEEGHGHDHGDLDPHFWHDPLLMADLADAVAHDLAEVDADHADDYAANADALRADLEQLDQEYADGLSACERSTVVVSHDAFGYLTRYGLEFEPVAGVSPDAEPTPADLGRLQRLIRDEGVTTVFSERLVSARLTQTLAEDLGVDTEVLDPLEGLTDDTADQDYLSLMRSNLAALKEANGCR